MGYRRESSIQEQGIKITDAVKELKEVLDKEPSELKPKLEASITEKDSQISSLEDSIKSTQARIGQLLKFLLVVHLTLNPKP